jgi:hypothetical protein
MKLARVFTLLTSICVFSLVTVGAATSVNAPGQANGMTPPCTAAMKASIPECPLTGCGKDGDAFLNQQKNRTDAPTGSITTKTLDQIRAMDQPSFWPTGTPRASIRGPGKEGSSVAVKGFLLKARAEGAESCNCEMTKRAVTDIHLVLVSQMPDTDNQDEIDQAELGSVTAEITPRVRQNGHPNWLFKNINDFEGEYVRATGRLMLDTKHLPPNQKLKRATNWEVHPITRFQERDRWADQRSEERSRRRLSPGRN